ncbi:MAG: alpha/beta fold hydrolase [Chloroflexi bacterium]|nr:alpha/beta fold hydrolase [Chloroflexota bacterium]
MPQAQMGPGPLCYEVDDFTDPWQPAQTILLHHGFGRSRRIWHTWVPLLARHLRVLRPDMRGFGQSPAPPTWRPTLNRLVDDVLGLLDALRLERVHFVGEALAGVIGIEIGARHPQRLHSLTLLSTPVRVSEEGRRDFALGTASWAAVYEEVPAAEWVRRTMAHRFDPARLPPEYVDWAASQIAHVPPTLLSAYAQLILDIDYTGGLPALTAPTLIIAGGSKLAPADQARFLAERIPESELVLFPDERHLVAFARPAECVAAVLDFIQRRCGGASL